MPSRPRAKNETDLEQLRRRYRQTRKPLRVCFRDLLDRSAASERYTHNLHHYPARLLAQIPAFFLTADGFVSPNSLVLDPFCGSGTVLLESLVRGHRCVGADANPLARLISRVKVTPLAQRALTDAVERVQECLPEKPSRAPDVINLEYWFYPHVARDLQRLLIAINRTRNEHTRDFLRLTFSSCLKDVSLADPRLSVPVRLRADQYSDDHWLSAPTKARIQRLRTIDAIKVFAERATRNIKMMKTLRDCPNLGAFAGLGDDARALTTANRHPATVLPGSVDLVITSPPYVGAQKYVRASSLSLTWLGMCATDELRLLEDQNIGREHHNKSSYDEYVPSGSTGADVVLKKVHKENPLRAHIASTYLREMSTSMATVAHALRRDGHLVLVVGEGTVCGRRFPTPTFLADMITSFGFETQLELIDPIRSRSLMTKRHHTAGVISSESVLVFTKRGRSSD